MYFKKILFFLLISFINISLVNANEKIVYIDIDKIIKTSISGNLIITELKKIQQQNEKNSKIQQKKIIDQEKEIKKLKNIISADDTKIKIISLQKNIKDFNLSQNKLNQEFLKKKKNLFNEYLKKITPLIEKYMDDNSINIVIDKKNIFIAKSNYDITNNIINLIDKNE